MTQGTLPSRLRYERQRRGLSVRDAAEAAGIDRNSLGRIEKGTQSATSATIRKMAKLFEIAPEELFEEAAERPKVGPSSEPHGVRMAGFDGRRREVGQPTIINKVYISDEELEHLIQSGTARGRAQGA